MVTIVIVLIVCLVLLSFPSYQTCGNAGLGYADTSTAHVNFGLPQPYLTYQSLQPTEGIDSNCILSVQKQMQVNTGRLIVEVIEVGLIGLIIGGLYERLRKTVRRKFPKLHVNRITFVAFSFTGLAGILSLYGSSYGQAHQCQPNIFNSPVAISAVLGVATAAAGIVLGIKRKQPKLILGMAGVLVLCLCAGIFFVVWTGFSSGILCGLSF